jgi:hypothetical protein
MGKCRGTIDEQKNVMEFWEATAASKILSQGLGPISTAAKDISALAVLRELKMSQQIGGRVLWDLCETPADLGGSLEHLTCKGSGPCTRGAGVSLCCMCKCKELRL